MQGIKHKQKSSKFNHRSETMAQTIGLTVDESVIHTPASRSLPSLYVLNAAALTKLHAIDHLTSELVGYNVDVALITETHLKPKHDSKIMNIQNYTLYRRDRIGRRCGGVAIYLRSALKSSAWTFSAHNSIFEIMWIRI